jgi:hypothetical protein
MLMATARAYSQDSGKVDFQTWNSIELGYKLNSKLSFELQEQLRLKENSATVDEYFTQLSGKYELFKNFDLGVGLRFIRANDNQGKIQGYENIFRYQFDGSYKYKFNRFTLSHRLRYQAKQELNNDEAEPKNQVRFKTSLAYNINHWKLNPEISGELFSALNDPDDKGIRKYRITLGTGYDMKDWGTVNLYYRMELPGVSGRNKANILGLGYSYTFKNKK